MESPCAIFGQIVENSTPKNHHLFVDWPILGITLIGSIKHSLLSIGVTLFGKRTINLCGNSLAPELKNNYHLLLFNYPGDFDTKVNEKFCCPVLRHNQILCLHHFNLRSLYFESLQSLPKWIQLHKSETSAICTPFQ